MGKTVESFKWLWRERSTIGAASLELYASLIEKLLTRSWICTKRTLQKAAMQLSPIVFEPMVMSILLFQQKRIRQLERELQAIKPELADPQATNLAKSQAQKVNVEPELKTSIKPAAIRGGQARLFSLSEEP